MGFEERLAILLSLDSRGAVREVQQFGSTAERELGTAEASSVRLGNRFIATGAVMVGVAATVGYGLVGMARQFGEAERSELLLDNTLARMPALAGANRDSFLELANAIQEKTAADGDQVVSAMAMLGTFKLTADEIRDATPLVVDYARKFGIDLTSAAIQVGKAMEGNVGTLQRNGVFVDENLYKTDRYTAVVKALRENAGGFAEAEGRTFEGRLASLKHELGDVAEGIGGGVVDAFSDLLDIGDPVIDVITGIDNATGGAIGQVATFGTIGLGAAGMLLTLAGMGIRAKGSLADLSETMPRTAAGIKGLAVAGGVIGVLGGLSAVLGEIAGNASGVFYEVKNLQATLATGGEDARRFANRWFEATGELGDAEEELRKLAEQSPTTARAMIEAADLAGPVRQRYTDIVRAEEQITRQAADAARADAEATKGVVQAKEEEVAARQAAVDAQIAEFSSELGLSTQLDELAVKQYAYNAALAAAAGSKYLNAEANANLSTAEVELKQQILDTAAAASRHAEDVAKASGKTDTAKIGAATYRAELGNLALSMAPDSPLRTYIIGLLEKLDDAGKDRKAKLDIDGTQAHNKLDKLKERLDDFTNRDWVVNVRVVQHGAFPYGV